MLDSRFGMERCRRLTFHFGSCRENRIQPLVLESPYSGPLAWYYSFKGSIALADSIWVYPHFADCVLIYQIKTTAAVHEDLGEMVSVDNWV